jgi:hypothetical protein
MAEGIEEDPSRDYSRDYSRAKYRRDQWYLDAA